MIALTVPMHNVHTIFLSLHANSGRRVGSVQTLTLTSENGLTDSANATTNEQAVSVTCVSGKSWAAGVTQSTVLILLFPAKYDCSRCVSGHLQCAC
jgi:hypothetical protein